MKLSISNLTKKYSNGVLTLANVSLDISKYTNRKDVMKYLCHPEGIFAVVYAALASNCKDAYGMTLTHLCVLCG